jgi:hypothetical protein
MTAASPATARTSGTGERPARGGLVLLYSVGVFAIIAAIGLSSLGAGSLVVETNQQDMYAQVALQAVYSGQAYAEALFWRLLQLVGRPPAVPSNFPCTGAGDCALPMPGWMGRVPTGGPYRYVELTRSQYQWTQQRVQGGTTVKLASRFRVLLAECSDPALPADCRSRYFDENVLRNGTFWKSGSSPFKPTQQALGGVAPPDNAFFYTLRIVGEAMAPDPAGTLTVVCRTMAKLGFNFQLGNPPATPRHVYFPRAFWFKSVRTGGEEPDP